MFLVQLKIQYHSCDTNKIFYWCNSSSYKCPKILYTKNSDKMAYANSADSDQSYQGLHCMLGHSTKYFKEQLHKKKKNAKNKWNKVFKILGHLPCTCSESQITVF